MTTLLGFSLAKHRAESRAKWIAIREYRSRSDMIIVAAIWGGRSNFLMNLLITSS